LGGERERGEKAKRKGHVALVPKLQLGEYRFIRCGRFEAKQELCRKNWVPKLDGLLPESAYGVGYFIRKIYFSGPDQSITAGNY
jgi:hypothetical protein